MGDPRDSELRNVALEHVRELQRRYTPSFRSSPRRWLSLSREPDELRLVPYRVWLQGDFSRALDVMIDDRFVQRVADSTGGDQNMAGGAEVERTGGRHVLTLLRAGGSARPGDGAPGRLIQTLLEPVDAQRAPRAWDPADWHSLCNRTDVDWLEVRRHGSSDRRAHPA